MPNTVGFDIDIANFPDGQDYDKLNDFKDALKERMSITPSEDIAFVTAGSTEPDSLTNNVWLRPSGDSFEWYVPDVHGNWVPIKLDERVKQTFVQDADPFMDSPQVDGSLWFKTENNEVIEQKIYYAGEWQDFGVTKAKLEEIEDGLEDALTPEVYAQATDPEEDLPGDEVPRDGALWLKTSGGDVVEQFVWSDEQWKPFGSTPGDVSALEDRLDQVIDEDNLLKAGVAETKDIFTAEGLAEVTQHILGKVFPVGFVVGITGDSRNPSEIYGIGTWQVFAPGRTLVGAGSGEGGLTVRSDGAEFGAEEVTLEIDNLPEFQVETSPVADADLGNPRPWGHGSTSVPTVDTKENLGFATAPLSKAIGSDEPFDICQPSKVVRFWKRTA